MEDYVPFCGLPPAPSEIATRWLLDPPLLAIMACALVVGLMFAERRALFAGGWILAALLFVSPLCALSMALFSARVGQHLLLTLLVAPMLASALPLLRLPSLPIAVVFAGLFWFWHAPGPYAATLSNDWIYWSMHISLGGAAVALFSSMMAASERAVPALLVTASQMTIYSLLLIFSANAWHRWHDITAAPFRLSAHADQQLAGGLMWFVGGALLLFSISGLVVRFLRQENCKATRSSEPQDAAMQPKFF